MTEVCSDGRSKLIYHIAPHQLASLEIDLTPLPITIFSDNLYGSVELPYNRS